jgi:hypothetical protein
MYKVSCGSTVDHEICFECESQWRAKMTIRDGKRVMTCPTCRQEETSRTVESLERELATLYVRSSQELTLVDAVRVIYALPPSTRGYVARRMVESTVSQQKVLCASGRECVTRSQVNPRVKTNLKCQLCHVVACCRSCAVCTECRPLA